MDDEGNNSDKKICSTEEAEVRKGPWTMEEDLILMNYIANHGEGVWNTLAKSAGLKRTGKSCRLRWLNYLRPDVRRGNITPEEQLLIMDLHSRWGNRWSKIARQLPGRTDNEIKNYWRTRIQKKPKQGETFDYMPTQLMADDASSSNPACMDIDYSGASHPQNYQMQPDNSQSNNIVNAFGAPSFSTPDASENFWTVDDFWSIQPPNGAGD